MGLEATDLPRGDSNRQHGAAALVLGSSVGQCGAVVQLTYTQLQRRLNCKQRTRSLVRLATFTLHMRVRPESAARGAQSAMQARVSHTQYCLFGWP